MKIIVREQADNDLDKICRWINQDSPIVEELVIRRIRQSKERLASGMSEIGLGRNAGTREPVEGPYIRTRL
jgi:plasmid stabilization system protein ParE